MFTYLIIRGLFWTMVVWAAFWLLLFLGKAAAFVVLIVGVDRIADWWQGAHYWVGLVVWWAGCTLLGWGAWRKVAAEVRWWREGKNRR